MRILLATVKVPFVSGGAELHVRGLCAALRESGHDADFFEMPFCPDPPERILDQMLACRLLEVRASEERPVDLLIGLKFPAYLVQHPNKVLWILHQHRQAYDLWNDPASSNLIHEARALRIREAIVNADRQLISQARAVYANSLQVAARLEKYCGIRATPLYHPPSGAELFYTAEPRNYFFFPSRILATKRQELVLAALRKTRQKVCVKFAGEANRPAYLRQLQTEAARHGLGDRVKWLGFVPEEDKRALYAESLAVLFPPLDEDLGYVTLEAMLSGKATITCNDSGGPLEFLENGVSGLVVKPEAEALAEAMDQLWADREGCARMGRSARESYRTMGISWQSVVQSLLSSSKAA